MYETIKNFLADGGRCLLIENGKPIGAVLTIEEYEKLKTGKLLIPRINSEQGVNPVNSIGEAMAKEMDFPEASAELSDINFADEDDVTLEDLGLDELPY